MLLQIPGVLNQGEIERLRSELAQASFEDGASTAGFVAREVKRNLQVPQNSEASRKCGAIVLDALRRNTMFYSAALPHRVHGPVFNRYDPGMTYGEHVDNALMFVDVLAEDMSFDRAIDTYVREMAIPEPLASTVATRTLVVLGQELVPYRSRAQEAEGERPKLRLNEASDGRQRTIKRA